MSEKEKEHSKIQWFFFVIFIPTVFAIVLVGIVLTFLGVNVIDQAKQIGSKVPVVSSLFVEKEEPDVKELLKTISENNDEIEKLQTKLEKKDKEVASLKEKLSVKEQELKREKMKEASNEEVKSNDELKDIAKTYESMSAKNAASILSELKDTEALLQISKVSIDKRAAILAKMEPEKAAKLMALLVDKEDAERR
ncbi:MAG TPA: MotE family protein [Bacilli bacterium]|nr:MotE family protein [Bacilli bacterium]